MASLSVAIQQPTSLVRAFALVDMKYFRPTKDGMSHKELWEQLKKYAPVAIIKEMGGFDTNSGKGVADYIMGTKHRLDDALGWLPEKADEVTWCAIWNAVKRETLAKHTSVVPNTEEHLRLAGERFTEVISKTQVYDSVLSKSANMRSKSMWMNMVTAFMAEPTTTINMMEDALRKGLRGNKKAAARTMASVALCVVINNLAASLIYAMRDDDEDETFIEKYMQSFVSGTIDDFIPLTYYPWLKDVWSALQGYDVSRADMNIITEAIQAAKGLTKEYFKDDDDRDIAGAWMDLAGAVSNFFGIPLDNIRREIKAGWNTWSTLEKDLSERDTTRSSLGDAIGEDLKKTIPVYGWFAGDSKTDKLYDAIISGDTVYVDRLKSSYKDEKAYNNAVRKALRENDPRIREAAEAQIGGDPSERVRIARLIIADGFDQDDVVMAINAEINALTSDGGSTGAKKKNGYYTASDFAREIVNGDYASADAARDDIIATAQKNGKTQKEAEEDFASNAKAEFRDLFVAGEMSESEASKVLKDYCPAKDGPLDDNDIYWIIKEWNYEKANGTADGYKKYNDFHTAVETGKNLRAVISEYTGHGVEEKTLAGEITSYFKPLYRDMSQSERAAIKRYLLNAYEVLGYDRTKKSKDIDKWLED